MNLLKQIFYFGTSPQQLQTENRKIFILNIWNFTAIVVQIPYILVALMFVSIYDAFLNINFAIVGIIGYILSYYKQYKLAYTLPITIYPIILTSIFWRFGDGNNILMLFAVIGLAVPFFFDNLKIIIVGCIYVIAWAFIASYIEFPDFLLKQPPLASQLFATLNLIFSVILGTVFVAVLNQENIRFEQNIISQNKQLKLQKGEIEIQKNDLLELHEELSQQNLVLQKSNEIIQEKNQTIEDSIQYAQRIQKSILPLDDYIKNYIPEYFIFFQPRDVVSGDFYYFEVKEGKYVLAAIDCTGHGVLGAFMSMIAHEMLNEIILVKKVLSPAQILKELHQNIRKTLKQNETDNRDGMDAALLTIDPKNKKIEYAGAKNPLIYIQNNELHLVNADKMPIGGEQQEQERIFTPHEMNTTLPTMFYLFSDGYQDQFGGEHNKKFGTARLKELFLKIHTLPLATQKDQLKETFEQWKNQSQEPQTDDVLVIGVKMV